MIRSDLAAGHPSPSKPPSGKRKHPIWALIDFFAPNHGWLSFSLLIGILAVVGNSVTSAGWVETPGLLGVILAGGATGLLLAKVRLPTPLLHIVSLWIGFVIVIWQTSILVGDNYTLVGQIRELWIRLDLWYDAATSGGISTDLIPFSLAISATGWLLGYVSSWFLFKNNNMWVALVISGITLLTNLSFLPDRFAFRFFLFMLLAMLLVVRVSAADDQELWGKARLRFDQTSKFMIMHGAVWLSVMVLFIAGVMPLVSVKSSVMANLWAVGRTPVQSLEEEFARLFAAIPSRKNLSGRFFGDTLPLLDKVSFNGEVVAWVKTTYPSYWLAQTYSEYTSKGWIAGPTTRRNVGPDALPPATSDLAKRVPVNQTLQFNFDTTKGLSGGNIEWISHESTFETLAPKQFEIDLLDPSGDKFLPQDIQELAATLRVELSAQRAPFIESHISRIIPNDLVLLNAERRSKSGDPSDLSAVTLARKEPISPEAVSWEFPGQLIAGEGYSIVSSVSVATDEDLVQAKTVYNGFIRDHYLQLPHDLPKRVISLAERLTDNKDTPLDKALAVQAFLRGSNFEYAREIESPPTRTDGVDYFLFVAKKGYSDYFASSMVVLMRASGVPARMAAGYGPGELDPGSGHRLIKDSDSHVWAQVYFPNYGWIDFEPTPNWTPHRRVLGTSPPLDGLPDEPSVLNPMEELIDPFEEEAEVSSEIRDAAQGFVWAPSRLFAPTAAALGILALLYIIWRLTWARSLVNEEYPERTFAKMSRLGAIAGISQRPNQTPHDYAMELGRNVPKIQDVAKRVALEFASHRYGDAPQLNEEQLTQAWRCVRGALLIHALERLLPGGSGAVNR